MSEKNAKFTIRMDFEDNATVALLFGEHNQNLMQIEEALDVKLDSFGNSIKISGASAASKEARKVIETLYKTMRDAGADEIDK